MTTPTPSAAMVERDAAVFFHQEGSSPCLSALRRVSGSFIESLDGQRWIDLHGNSAHHIGHANPELIAALKQQLDELTFSPRRYANEPATELAELLTARWPSGPAKVLFTTGGSDAIELAVKMARVVTGRSATISIEGSYHGHGLGAFGLSRAEPDRRLGSFLPDRIHVRAYWKHGAAAMLEDVAQALRETTGGVAALIAEPMRSNCHVPPPDLWPEIRRLCDAAGTLLIFDEIPSGLGKTGRFFAFEHFGAQPDMVVLGKALGGGVLPMAAVLADARFDIAPELALGHYTHEKNPLTTRAALTCLRIILRDKLSARAARLESVVRNRIGELAREGSLLRSVRGKGLLLALEFDVTALGSVSEPDLLGALLKRGVSTTTKGDDAIGFSPPLTVAEADLVSALDNISAALDGLKRR
ncbi:aspartate aminotransferase family protein [Nostoc sp. 3335mG]|nr:aspartate aminotransferase family protein [Nostoc sp. 3335mG]